MLIADAQFGLIGVNRRSFDRDPQPRLPAKFGNIAKCYVERLDDDGNLFVSTLSYNQNKQLVQTPELVLRNIMIYINQFRMINDALDFGFDINGVLFSAYFINFGVKFTVNSDRRFNSSDVKIQVINTIKDFFKIEKMQFRQTINLNDLQYNILGLEGVMGIKKLELFQDTPDGSDDGTSNRQFYYYAADGSIPDETQNSNYGFKYEFGEGNATEDGIVKPSMTPSVFELRNPDADIYGKVV